MQILRGEDGYTRAEAMLLDVMLMLHAEHGGGNNSTFACRVLSSSATDAYSAYAAAIGSLKGPRHGGANAKVVAMHEDIRAHVTNWMMRMSSPRTWRRSCAARLRRQRSYLRHGARGLYPV